LGVRSFPSAGFPIPTSLAAGRPACNIMIITEIGAEDRRFLLDLARETLVRSTAHLPPQEVQGISEALKAWRACFVTLTHNGGLRGCVGQLISERPLFEAVMENVRRAASRDPRFPPLQPGELENIKIEITVVTEPHELSFESPEELLGLLRPHEHGVLLRLGSAIATFSPQVWEQIPDKIQFLERLSQKLGASPGAWRNKQACISVFQAEWFEEN
jgi:AmmeMemoRadiSam system protein A